MFDRFKPEKKRNREGIEWAIGAAVGAALLVTAFLNRRRIASMARELAPKVEQLPGVAKEKVIEGAQQVQTFAGQVAEVAGQVAGLDGARKTPAPEQIVELPKQ